MCISIYGFSICQNIAAIQIEMIIFLQIVSEKCLFVFRAYASTHYDKIHCFKHRTNKTAKNISNVLLLFVSVSRWQHQIILEETLPKLDKKHSLVNENSSNTNLLIYLYKNTSYSLLNSISKIQFIVVLWHTFVQKCNCCPLVTIVQKCK